MPVQQFRIRAKLSNAAGVPFCEQNGTSSVSAKNPRLEKILLLRNEVYAINPEAIRKQDIVKMADYAYALCGLTYRERIAVVFDNEKKVSRAPKDRVSLVSPISIKNSGEEELLHTLRHEKWKMIKNREFETHNNFVFCNHFAPFPRIKLLAMIYSIESNNMGVRNIDYNSVCYVGLDGSSILVATDSKTHPAKIFLSSVLLSILNGREMKKENYYGKDFSCKKGTNSYDDEADYIQAIESICRVIDPHRETLIFSNIDHSNINTVSAHIQARYAGLDSLKAVAKGILD